MSLLNMFSLAKLEIEGFLDEKRKRSAGTFTAQYNPDSFSIQHRNEFSEVDKKAGNLPSIGDYSSSPAKHLSVKLILDGTDVAYSMVDRLLGAPTVAEQIANFTSVCYRSRNTTHEPAYLRLRWGNALGGGFLGPSFGSDLSPPYFDCRLESVDINYTALDRDGSPLSAELNASFGESVDPEVAAKAANLNSPDLTHRRVVMSGDTLPLLCREIYGSASYYLRVAQVNGLDDFRTLVPGDELFFPPFERTGED